MLILIGWGVYGAIYSPPSKFDQWTIVVILAFMAGSSLL
jgi:hypothetical protein